MIEQSPNTDAPVLVRGTGSIGMRHLRVLSSELGVACIAWPVRPKTRLEPEWARGLPVVNDLAAARSHRPRAVIVATDTSRHIDDALELAGLTPNVMVEKPLSPDAPEATRLRRELAQPEKIYVACCMRFEPGLQLVRKLLDSIGSVYRVDISCQSYLPNWRPNRNYRESYSARLDEGGVLRDLIHEVDYAGWLFGFPQLATGIVSHTGRLQIPSDDLANLLWTTSSGAHVHVQVNYLTERAERRMGVWGELGQIHWDGLGRFVKRELNDGTSEQWDLDEPITVMYRRQLQEYLAVVEGQAPTHLATLADGIAALRLCDQVRAASNQHPKGNP